MAATRTATLPRTAASTTYAGLLAVAALTPVLGLPQLVTGSLVNASMLTATVLLGPRAAVSIAVLPSLFALAFGQLPAPLAPLVPVIILGNVVLITVFDRLLPHGWWRAALVAAVAKYCLLLGTTGLLVITTGLLPAATVPVALSMMGWAQLLTALSGAAIAYAALRPAWRP